MSEKPDLLLLCTIANDHVLGEVPSDITVWYLLLQVLVNWRSVLTLDIDCGHEGLLASESFRGPLLNFRI